MAIIRYSESIYKQNQRFSSCPGSEEIPDYKLDFPVTGGVRLVQKGTKPLYKIIQANKVNCDLQSVLEQCVHQNQLAVCDINDVTSAIADFSGLSSMSEWYAGMKHLEETWKNTPVEVREQFNSSKAYFINAIGTPDFAKKLEDGYIKYSDAYKKRLDVPKPSPAPAPIEPTPAPIEPPKGSDE